jgi:3-isopropylmalate dehydrogenase
MSEFKIAVIKGDGIGPDIVIESENILNKIGEKYNHKFIFTDVLMGGIAIDKTGVPLPDETVKICLDSQAVLLGAIGGEKWDKLPGHLRPEAGLLGIRKALGLYANLRPATINKNLAHSSTLKPEVIENVDIMVVRELCGGIYFGEKKRGEDNGSLYALDTEKYYDFEVDRITKTAFEIAKKRKKKLCSVDKANVLESSRFWRERVINIAKDYTDVELSHMYVDNAAMQLVRNPGQFDVIVTSNMFGDILSDEASMICGSIGMLPSASLREDNFGLYEPIHGSAPDIAGKNIANPIATILSCAMMLRYTFDLETEASAIENAVNKTLEQGYRTTDIVGDGVLDVPQIKVGTVEMGEKIRENIL